MVCMRAWNGLATHSERLVTTKGAELRGHRGDRGKRWKGGGEGGDGGLMGGSCECWSLMRNAGELEASICSVSSALMDNCDTWVLSLLDLLFL